MSELGIKKLHEINALTLTEFYYRMYALEFINLKEDHNLLKLAFFIRDVAVTENRGTEKKPEEHYIYGSISDIMDYQENYYRLFEGKECVYKANGSNKEATEEDHKLAAIFAEFNNRK